MSGMNKVIFLSECRIKYSVHSKTINNYTILNQYHLVSTTKAYSTSDSFKLTKPAVTVVEYKDNHLFTFDITG